MTTDSRRACPLVIGYSQGSVITNRAYTNLLTRRDAGCTTTVHIGSPDTVVEGVASSHVTLEEDSVVDLVRTLPGNTLPANVTNPEAPGTNGHGILTNYTLEGVPSRELIELSIDNSVFCNSEGNLGIGLAACPLR